MAARHLQQVDDLALRRETPWRFRPARSITFGARDLTRKDDGLVADSDGDVFAGEQRVQMLLERGDRRFDDDVVLSGAGGRPDDQADGSRLLPIDEDLTRRDDDRVGNLGVRDGDSRDVEVVGTTTDRPAVSDTPSMRRLSP